MTVSDSNTEPSNTEEEEEKTCSQNTDTANPAETVSEDVSQAEVQTNGVSPENKEENEIDRRSFSIRGLRNPGGWRTNSEVINLLARCDSFHISFESAPKGPKVGYINLIFDSIASARDAFSQSEKMKIDGETVQLDANPVFFEAATCHSRPFFTISSDESVRSRTIYALHLLSSTNKDILFGIIGSDSIDSISFLPLDGTNQQAEIVMSSPEVAASTCQEVTGFELDDGENKSCMKICSSDEYAAFVAEERKPRPFAPSSEDDKAGKSRKRPNTHSVAPVVESAPIIDEDDVTDAFIKHIEEQRMNWAELNEKEELYELCDVISGLYGGLPDSILKPAMLKTLQRHLVESTSHWMKEHIQQLIQLWKSEVVSEVPFSRETQVQMKAPDYAPVEAKRKRHKNKESSRAGRVMLGVGAFLQSAKQTFKTEQGTMEVEEDESGNILIGGEALSFGSWGKWTNSSEPDVVSMHQKKQTKPKKPEIHDYKKFKQEQKEAREKRMGNKKRRIMDKARKEMEELERAELEAAANEGIEEEETEPAKPPKELDEGEIDSDDEKEEKKRKEKRKSRRNSSSSSSSSSSSESDEDPADARGRRRQRRQKDRRKAPQALYMNPIISKMFENRHALVAALPPEQKTVFATILHKLSTSRGSVSATQQQNVLQKFSDVFSGMGR